MSDQTTDEHTTTGSAPRIRLGQVGGGRGAFIGAVHRIASRIDDRFELVAGAFSSTPERSQASGAELGLDAARVYSDFAEMAAREAARDDGIEAVSIVTPNHLHYPVAKVFLERGIHVICDKPLTSTLEDARALAEAAARSDALFVLTHNYSGYPMVRHAREMVAAGDLGRIRIVQVEYPQDWLARRLQATGDASDLWRTDPAQSGIGGAIGDVGTHAYHLAGFVSGLKGEAVLADLDAFALDGALDTNAHVLLRYEGGAKGMLWCSQVAPGNENALRLRVYGETGGLVWEQEHPNHLWHAPLGEPKRLLTRAGSGAGEAAARVSRVPAGHPEGYLEGFATIYTEAAAAIRARRRGEAVDPAVTYPTLEDGVAGMVFVAAAVESSAKGACGPISDDRVRRAQMIACRTLAETHSDSTTVPRMTRKITVTWGQASVLSEAWSWRPMPPAPTRPRMVDSRMLMSQRKTAMPAKAGRICGTMAWSITCARPAPVAVTASICPSSTSSIAS